MDNIIIKAGARNPLIELKADGNILIKGRSTSNECEIYFIPVVKYLEAYALESERINITFYFEYMHSTSMLWLRRIFDILKNISMAGQKVKITWEYDEIDEDIMEKGEFFRDEYDLKININPV